MDNTAHPTAPIHPDTYSGYKGLPTLVGLHTMSEAVARGLTVEESVARLKRLHWAMERLRQIFISHITAMPIYELKMAFSLHAFYCAEHARPMAERVKEMRQPPYGLDEPPHAALEIFFDEIQCAPTVEALVWGLYDRAIPAVAAALQGVLTDTHRLFDHPTWRLCRLALVEFDDVLEYGRKAVECLVDAEARKGMTEWSDLLQQCLAAAGGLDGTAPSSDVLPRRIYSRTPYRYDPFPKRDERFVDPYNAGVHAEGMLHDPAIPAPPKTLMLYFKRLREIDVPEMMASILTETRDQPWGYYRDMTRQLWDEARHTMMGEIGFVSLGIDWTRIPIPFNWSLALNTRLTPQERHAVLFAIELGLMPRKTGKAYEWEVAVASTDHVAALAQDYDWADEILHARIGSDWLVDKIGSAAETKTLGDACFTRALNGQHLAEWQAAGLTAHRNWWPEVYRQACEHWGIEPAVEIVEYDTAYRGPRAVVTSG